MGILNLNFQIFPADKRVYLYCEVLKGKIFHSSDQMARKKGHTRKSRSLILPFTKEMTFKSGPWVGGTSQHKSSNAQGIGVEASN